MTYKSELTEEQQEFLEESISDLLNLFGLNSGSNPKEGANTDTLAPQDPVDEVVSRHEQLAFLVDHKLASLASSSAVVDAVELSAIANCVMILEKLNA